MTNNNFQTYSPAQHGINIQQISQSARAIINSLSEHNYDAYIVGGAVRDLLLGHHPKDFDIATNATPAQIKKVFGKECRIIGRRFKLAHVYHKREMFEVATFRGVSKAGNVKSEKGHIICDNVFGSIDQDAQRRDFTCNALYFDIHNGNILDFCNGIDDIRLKRLSFIGEDDIRIIEDPVRMIRAIRFESKLGLKMSDSVKSAIIQQYKTLSNVSLARLFDELVKLFHCGNSVHAFALMSDFLLFKHIFPQAFKSIMSEKSHIQFIQNALMSTDLRIKHGKSVTPIFLFACFLWPWLAEKATDMQSRKKPAYDAMNISANEIFQTCRNRVAIPRMIQIGIRNIWLLQLRLEKTQGKKVFMTLQHPRFRAGYDFMILRKHESKKIESLCEWWTHIQTLSKTKQRELIFTGKQKKRKNQNR